MNLLAQAVVVVVVVVVVSVVLSIFTTITIKIPLVHGVPFKGSEKKRLARTSHWQ